VFEEAYKPPVSDGTGQDRKLLRDAGRLLGEAGWHVKDGKRVNANGEVFEIEFLIADPAMERILSGFVKNLQAIGVQTTIRRIDPGPIRFLVNTHVHPDHTAGNATFAKAGAVLLAREELREGLARQTAADPARLPVITYGMGDPVKFRMNGEVVELIPVRAAHTGGDTMIRFVNADAIMVGDFYRNFGYPFIDTNNGGSLKGALEALELTMKIAGPNTRLIPGHGTFINRTEIVPYRDMILAVQAKVQQLIGQGKTLPEVLAAKVTSPYDAKVPGGLLPAGNAGTSADRFVSMVYAQLKDGH